MSAKSTIAIEDEMYTALEDIISKNIAGTFYPSDTRPVDAETEDAVLTVSGADAEQIQSGRARINIYVKDLDIGQGRKVPDKERMKALAELDSEIIDALNSYSADYDFSLFKATDSNAVPGMEVHYVNIGISFNYTAFQN
jgi:hypothetical protein